MDKKENVGRIYLSVPYQKKDLAKELGAKWDPEGKKWFLPVTLFKEQWENAQELIKRWGINNYPRAPSQQKNKRTMEEILPQCRLNIPRNSDLVANVQAILRAAQNLGPLNEKESKILNQKAASLLYCLALENHYLRKQIGQLHQQWLEEAQNNWINK